MKHLLSPAEANRYGELVALVEGAWGDRAADWERTGDFPDEVVRWCADQGLLGASLPAEWGGGGVSALETGLMHEALGGVSASLASLVNVHGMAAHTIAKWGTEDQWAGIMPALAKGERLAAVCMTEPQAGSDLSLLTSELAEREGRLVLNGTKVFITFGAMADVFLVFAQRAGQSVACVVERGTPGLRTEPMEDLLGLRAARLARVEFEDCEVSPENVVGRDGFGVSVLAPVALEHGRHAVAWMAVGMLRSVFEAAAAFAAERRAFGATLIEHGQIQTLITRMGTDLEASRLLCVAASRAMDAGDPAMTDRVLMAKYFACRALEEHASQAVQILGSSGVLGAGVAARAYRDAKVLNIIEGTGQIIERMLAPRLVRAAARGRVT
ncbi:acyl-CoA dehydrogenase family protein [Streptomyces sp. NPDC059979]|uniref:acyl-CoA dehydrogenase family protein n=1 Tax=unclassified Streptomyces TaxID=2593676 RepID=UPI00365F3A70